MAPPRTKYPRTPHLPWSGTVGSDDRVLSSTEHFLGHEVVVTEKVDGENTTIYPDGYLHARSIDGADHPSRHLAKGIAARVASLLPPDTRLVAENAYAVHAIAYGAVPPLAVIAAVADGTFLSWDATERLASRLGLETVPVLWRGAWDEAAVRGCHTGLSAYGGPQEGYVVRLASAFREEDFGLSVAKFVREGHVPGGTPHWRSGPLRRNPLR